MSGDGGSVGASGPLEAVVFDWGGTLSLWADVDMYDMWILAATHLDPSRADELARRLVRIEEQAWAEVGGSCASWRLGEMLGRASRELGLDVTDAVLEEASVRHIDAWTPHIRHAEDAQPVLRALRQSGLKIGLLSNTHWPRAIHQHFLERDGLLALLDADVYSCELTHVKPHRVAFETVLRALDVRDAARAVMVGDRMIDDISGAQAMGMKTVFKSTSATPRPQNIQPDAIITRLSELPAIVNGWREP